MPRKELINMREVFEQYGHLIIRAFVVIILVAYVNNTVTIHELENQVERINAVDLLNKINTIQTNDAVMETKLDEQLMKVSHNSERILEVAAEQHRRTSIVYTQDENQKAVRTLNNQIQGLHNAVERLITQHEHNQSKR